MRELELTLRLILEPPKCPPKVRPLTADRDTVNDNA